MPIEYPGEFCLRSLRVVGQFDDQAHIRCIIAVGQIDEEVPDQLARGGVFHLQRGPLPVCLPDHGQPHLVVRMRLTGDPGAHAVEDPDLRNLRVQVHQLSDEVPVLQFHAVLLKLGCHNAELEEVAVVGRGQIRILPELSGGELGDDPVGRKGVVEPDLRDPVVKGGEGPKVAPQIGRIGGVLDDAALVDDVQIHLFPEFLFDAGEVHLRRAPPRPLVLGKDRAEPLPHLGV
ncbi:hypothetical protein [Methanoculleus sp. MH98A]|uniref:hypothetical protein n=1 Tax=Methanoculleus sp. MH98A TaxID=1495314 RepID=UPI0004A07D6A|nr:hypothetical protein [Methanoculleus sp. MH98A]KDE55349.1 hypothetical protein EI28_07720 [Methanoculleus sp. MH98A]